MQTRACPKCKQPAQLPCKTPTGGYYNPRYNLHAARERANG
jgi:hypothetical protein